MVLFRFLKLIKNLFMLTEGEYIELTGRGMEVVSTEGRFLLNAYGDGYKNTSGWVLDVIAWNMIAGRLPDPNMMTGIVLTDEIEQHLHPEWQRHYPVVTRTISKNPVYRNHSFTFVYRGDH